MTRPAPSQQFTADERRKYIGCSELAVIMGVDRFNTPLDLYNRKMGLTPDIEVTKHMTRGIRLESIAAELFTELTGTKLRRMTRDLIHPEYPFIRGHVDRIIEGQKVVVEIKVASVAAYRKFQREGLPASYVIQLNAYMGLGGYPQGVFCIFCPDQFDLISFDVTFDEELYRHSIEAARDFWNDHILKAIAPTAEKQDKEAYEIANIGGEAIIRTDDEFVTWADELREAKQLIADAEELYDTVSKRGLELISNQPGVYRGGCVTLHYKEQAGRVTFDKKALAAAHPELDLEPFHKQGKPFTTFRPYFTKDAYFEG